MPWRHDQTNSNHAADSTVDIMPDEPCYALQPLKNLQVSSEEVDNPLICSLLLGWSLPMNNTICNICVGNVTMSILLWPLPRGNLFVSILSSLQWRHNEHDDVSNHRRLDGLLSRLFRRRPKKNQSSGELLSQKARNAENVSILWRHHDNGNISRVI